MQKTIVAIALAFATTLGRAQTPPASPAAPAPAKPAEPPAAKPAESLAAKPAEPPPSPAPAARAEPLPAKAPVPRGAVLEEVSGTVREVDRKAHKLAVETAAGNVTLSLDRNTMVYTTTGLGTVLDVAPGQQVRAGRNADFLAYWVQVRGPAKTEPPTTPGQGTGPAGGGAAPAGEAGGTGTGAGPAPGTPPVAGPGSVPPGGAPPGR